MENSLARLEQDHGGHSDEDRNEVEEVEELEDGYEDCGIGSYEIFALNNEPVRRVLNDQCNVRRGTRQSIFCINCRMQNSDGNIDHYRVLMDTGATVNVAPESFIEILMQSCSANPTITDCPPSTAQVASGGSINFEPYEAHFDIRFSEKIK